MKSKLICSVILVIHWVKYQCCVRVQIVKSESESSPLSESESSPLSPSPSHHLQVRVRVITSESESESKKKFKSESRVQSSTYSIFLYIPKHENKQKNIFPPSFINRVEKLGLRRDSARVTSHDFWVRVRVKVKVMDSSLSHQKMDSSPSPYSSHTALLNTQKTTTVPQTPFCANRFWPAWIYNLQCMLCIMLIQSTTYNI